MVIYDLDSLPCPYSLPIIFREQDSLEYPIPVFDMRRVEDFDGLSLPFSNVDIIDKIYQGIAKKIILNDFNLPLHGVSESIIIKHLKATNFLVSISNKLKGSAQVNTLNLFIRALTNESQPIHFNINLNIQDLEQVILSILPIADLTKIAHNHPDYNFVIISPYNGLPSVQSALNSDFFLPDVNQTEFRKIWQRKLSENFPLYWPDLNQISFCVGDDWINVPSNKEHLENAIVYEGKDKGQEFLGSYTKGEKIYESIFNGYSNSGASCSS